MVRIEHNAETESESETETSEGESSDEEDIDSQDIEEILPERLEAPELSDDTASGPTTPEELDSDEESVDEETTKPRVPQASTFVQIGVTNVLNVRFLLDRYGKKQNSVQNRQITSKGLSKFVSEMQDKATPISGTFAGARTPADNWMPIIDDGCMKGETTAAGTSTNLFQIMETKKVDDEDDSTKEKSNGLGEKQQLGAGARALPVSSPEMTDCELSDVSDSQFSLDYDYVLEPNTNKWRKLVPPSSDWTKTLSVDTNLDGESAAKEPDFIEEQGEAIALPASFECSRQDACQPDDDRLFALETDVFDPAPSTSTAEDIPSPTTERRRVKLENRERAQRQRSIEPFEGNRERYITVPTEKIGRIVGKGGVRIKEIERQSKTKIRIEDRKSKKPFTKIYLVGTDEQITVAVEAIALVSRNYRPAEPGEAAPVAVSHFDEMELRQLLINIKYQVAKK